MNAAGVIALVVVFLVFVVSFVLAFVLAGLVHGQRWTAVFKTLVVLFALALIGVKAMDIGITQGHWNDLIAARAVQNSN
jgi:hypothetical protein